MNNSINDNQSKEGLPRQKFVKRLINVPEVVWNENFVRLFQIFGLPFKNTEFNIYNNVDLVPFIANATNAFRTELIGHALNFVGIKITFAQGSEDTELIPQVTIDKEREIYAIETIKALTRNYESTIKLLIKVLKKTKITLKKLEQWIPQYGMEILLLMLRGEII